MRLSSSPGADLGTSRAVVIPTLVVAALACGLASPTAAQEGADRGAIAARISGHVRDALDRALAQRTRDRDRGRDSQEQVERQTRTLKLGPSGQLDLTNISGDVTITAGGRDETTIEIVKRGRGPTDEEARRQLGLVEAEIIERAGRAEVRVRYTEGERRYNASVDYNVTTPAGTRVRIRSVSGDVRVTGVKGEVDLETVSGDVTLDGIGQLTHAKTVSGDLEISGVDVDGTLDASSVSGDLTARRIKARRVELGTVSGTVDVSDVTCDSATARTMSGDVRFAGSLAKSGRYEFTSHSGDVQLSLGGDVGFEIEASTFSGSINSDLPLTVGGRSGQRRSDRSIRGVYGDGSALLNVTTFSGSVIIRKR
jgi:DUF4097 and DUF4098 domain-containing protein YvlB